TVGKSRAGRGKAAAVGAARAEIAVGTDGDGAAKRATAATPASEKTPTLPSPASDGGKEAPTLPSPVNGGGKKTSPVEVTEGAELLAKAKGIDLATIKGSGPGGSSRRR